MRMGWALKCGLSAWICACVAALVLTRHDGGWVSSRLPASWGWNGTPAGLATISEADEEQCRIAALSPAGRIRVRQGGFGGGSQTPYTPEGPAPDLGEQFEPDVVATPAGEWSRRERVDVQEFHTTPVKQAALTHETNARDMAENPFERDVPRRPTHGPVEQVAYQEEEPLPELKIPPKSGSVGTGSTASKKGAVPAPVSSSNVKGMADKPGSVVNGGAESALDKGGALLDLAEIEKLIVNQDVLRAHRELSRWYWRTPAKRDLIRPELEKLADVVYFAPQPHVFEPYVVQPNDQLRLIAKKYKVSWEYLARLNRVDPKKIRAGQKLKVVEGPFSAYVTLSTYELVVHHNGNFVKRYRVGVGKDGTTPIGTFTVKNKEVDPTYYGPEGVISHSDPKNPLGERWIDIGDSFGIHGTIDPKSIGKNESRGCVRMLNEDVEEVYDFLTVGSEVRIQK